MVVVVVAAAVPSKIWMIVTSTYYSLVVMWMEEPNVMIVAAAFCILVEYFCLPKNMYLPPPFVLLAHAVMSRMHFLLPSEDLSYGFWFAWNGVRYSADQT